MQAAFRLALLYCDDARWDEAEALLSFYRGVPDRRLIGTTVDRLLAEARIAAHRGDDPEATAYIRQATELLDGTDRLNAKARASAALAEVHHAAGRTAEADAALATALELYEQKGNVAAVDALRLSRVAGR
jgi:hypothetical protein